MCSGMMHCGVGGGIRFKIDPQFVDEETEALAGEMICLDFTVETRWGHSDSKFSTLSIIIWLPLKCHKIK